MVRSIVSRNDDLYECFPDLALCDDGTLACVYREGWWRGDSGDSGDSGDNRMIDD